MSSMKLKALVLALSASVLAGCASSPDEGMAPVDQAGGSQTYGDGANGGLSSNAMDGQNGAGYGDSSGGSDALRDVRVFYFDYNSSDVRPELRDALATHARFLAANPSASAVLEGHGDERGTNEYNLALGERRANAIQRFLVVSGASGSQLEVVSYGEERPAVYGNDESSYAKNRRVELNYK